MSIREKLKLIEEIKRLNDERVREHLAAQNEEVEE